MNVHEMARALGRRGGRLRAQRLSADRRKQIASLGGSARARSLQAARRLEDNFRYAAAMEALRDAARPRLRRQRHDGRLPGIYSRKR